MAFTIRPNAVFWEPSCCEAPTLRSHSLKRGPYHCVMVNIPVALAPPIASVSERSLMRIASTSAISLLPSTGWSLLLSLISRSLSCSSMLDEVYWNEINDASMYPRYSVGVLVLVSKDSKIYWWEKYLYMARPSHWCHEICFSRNCVRQKGDCLLDSSCLCSVEKGIAIWHKVARRAQKRLGRPVSRPPAIVCIVVFIIALRLTLGEENHGHCRLHTIR